MYAAIMFFGMLFLLWISRNFILQKKEEQLPNSCKAETAGDQPKVCNETAIEIRQPEPQKTEDASRT